MRGSGATSSRRAFLAGAAEGAVAAGVGGCTVATAAAPAAVPNTVVAEGRYRATSNATGKPSDAQVAHVWDFRDGKVVAWQQYTDTCQFSQVTGIEPKH